MFDPKMITASVVAAVSFIADATMAPVDSWESVGLKTALILAIIYLVRDNAKQRTEAATEAGKREERFASVIESNTRAKEANTHAMGELKAATDLQTAYYKTVAQTLLSKDIKPHLPHEP